MNGIKLVIVVFIHHLLFILIFINLLNNHIIFRIVVLIIIIIVIVFNNLKIIRIFKWNIRIFLRYFIRNGIIYLLRILIKLRKRLLMINILNLRRRLLIYGLEILYLLRWLINKKSIKCTEFIFWFFINFWNFLFCN